MDYTVYKSFWEIWTSFSFLESTFLVDKIKFLNTFFHLVKHNAIQIAEYIWNFHENTFVIRHSEKYFNIFLFMWTETHIAFSTFKPHSISFEGQK